MASKQVSEDAVGIKVDDRSPRNRAERRALQYSNRVTWKGMRNLGYRHPANPAGGGK
jgi:hypothetical protein